MATNSDALLAAPGIRQAAVRSLEHRFFKAVAMLFPLLTFAGFARSYYLKFLSDAPPLPGGTAVHIHGLVMSAWVVLFSVQAYLGATKRIKLHIALGMIGIGLAAAVLVTGTITSLSAVKRGGTFPGFTPNEFLMIPTFDLVMFAAAFIAAIIWRRRPADHKRMMLMTMLCFLPPSLARLPLEVVMQLGPIFFLGVPILIGAAAFAVDSYRRGRVNRAFAVALGLFTVISPIRLVLAKTETWNDIAEALVRIY
ncbi:MAG: hypothetical protein KF736_04100 [Acidobacteria bacterium]|nr:hypothetical protein [Acidobacteriota bacterium]MCW5948435.1 hypothetical protein [Pyrinomonadaceae bacterium]